MRQVFPASLHDSNDHLPFPVTIIILTWNAVQETYRLIESLIRLPLPENAELLFIDNGSKDHTIAYLKSHNLKIIRNAENRGYTIAVNQGIQSCLDDVVLLNNDMVIIQKNWLYNLQQTAYQTDDIGVVGCRLMNYQGKIIHAGGEFKSHEGINIHGNFWEHQGQEEPEFVTFGCVYLRRRTIERIGLLDEQFFAYCEDSDYCLRCRQGGLKIIMDGRTVILHHEHGSTLHNRHQFEQMLQSSQAKFVAKWRDWLDRRQ